MYNIAHVKITNSGYFFWITTIIYLKVKITNVA